MPRIMLPNQMMLSQSKTSLSSRRNSSSWSSYRANLSASVYHHGSVEMRIAAERRNSLEKGASKSQEDPSRGGHGNEASEASDSTPDDWGFFVDIAPFEEREIERTFLNGYGAPNKLKPIADSGF